MATFEAVVLPVNIEAHSNADSLEIARIGEYRSIVRKGDFKSGDLVAYIPEGAVLPDQLIAEMGLTGRLAGGDKNRVKAVKLRGVLSQGLCYPAREGWAPGSDVATELGIWKYEPVVPAGFSGELMSVGTHRTMKYDIENYKKYPDVFQDGELVVFTEKLHGTFAMFGVMSNDEQLSDAYNDTAYLVVGSKGVAAQGLAFKVDSEANKNNLYVRTALELTLVERCYNYFGDDKSVFIMGEIFGPGVQDLNYGLTKTEFRVFDIYVGSPGKGEFLNDVDLDTACAGLKLARVPVIYRGPFSKEVLEKYTNGKETISGTHVREGVVVRAAVERRANADLPCYDRAQLKSVSEGYLLRKGEATEYA